MTTKQLFDKITSHSHILGIDKGIFGQNKVKKALLHIKKMATNGSGNLTVLCGPRGTGKTALGIALCREIGESSVISAFELRRRGISFWECLRQLARAVTQVEIRESYEVVDGELIDVKNEMGVRKVTLRTLDMESVFEIGEGMYKEMCRERVEIGDVVRINRTTGKFRKLGKCTMKREICIQMFIL